MCRAGWKPAGCKASRRSPRRTGNGLLGAPPPGYPRPAVSSLVISRPPKGKASVSKYIFSCLLGGICVASHHFLTEVTEHFIPRLSTSSHTPGTIRTLCTILRVWGCVCTTTYSIYAPFACHQAPPHSIPPHPCLTGVLRWLQTGCLPWWMDASEMG